MKDQLDGVLDLARFETGGQLVSLDVYMLDTKRFAPEIRFPVALEELKQKVATEGGYELILSGDDNALLFLREHKDSLFGIETPVVFLGVNDYALAERSAELPEYTGIVEKASLAATVEAAFRLLPKLERLVVLFDGTPTSQGEESAFRSEVPKALLEKCSFLNLSDYTYAEAGVALSGLGEKDAVYFISPFRDREGTSLAFWQIVNWLKTNTDRPIFFGAEYAVGQGIAGGKVVSHLRMAQLAVGYAERILSGESVADLPLIMDEEACNFYLFDYEVLEAARADLSQLPLGATLINPPNSFWDRYLKWLILYALFAVCLVVFGFVVTLLYLRQKRILRDLRESEDQISSVFENCYVPMVIVNLESGYIVDVNPEAVRFYGYKREEMIGVKWHQFSNTTETDFAENCRKLKEGSRFVVETKHLLASGEVREVEAILALIYRDSVPHLFSIIQDATERNEWQRNLIDSKKALEEANNAKDQFLSVMSHELRTPLNPIIGFASMMQKDAKEAEVKDTFRIILDSAKRMLQVVDNILNYINVKGGSVTPGFEAFSVRELLTDLVSEYRENDGRNELSLRLEADGCEGAEAIPDVWSDPILLRQILDNLLSNACKFTKEGIVEVGCHLEADASSDADYLCHIWVSDTGMGISEEMKRKVFLPFTQADSTNTRMFDGVGMGLALVKELVTVLGGTIEWESSEGAGSCFRIRFPLNRAVKKGPFLFPHNEGWEKGRLKPDCRILVVEDNQENAFYLKRCLEGFGVRVELAEDGAEGCSLAEETRFDLILLDLSMPNMNGFEAMKRIGRDSCPNQDTPVFVVTAHVDRETEKRCLHLGAKRVLTKPVDPLELFQTLEVVLESN